ncbi:hypothetical protein FA13DRAFT_229074 [Coprinellus micaceus]|uniref:Uncharacterized protein n=1 Tax=Coprinellus micaceus TaxID=71717 RepID=A0A4Y7TF85_COPMI|nr:hypothetical protein FA13DRAFT_229074 [Coprinellus micaceus]
MIYRLRVRLERKRNDEERAEKKLYTCVFTSKSLPSRASRLRSSRPMTSKCTIRSTYISFAAIHPTYLPPPVNVHEHPAPTLHASI